MRLFLLGLLPLIFLAAPALAQDPLIAKAVAKIASVESAEANLKAGDQAGAKKLLGDLTWAEKRLNAVGKNKGSAEWKAAEKRLQAARTKVEAKANAPAPKPQPQPTPQPKPTPGSGPKPAPAPAPTPTPTPAPAPTYDHAKLVQLNKEVGNAWNNLKIVPLRLMNDESRVRSVQKEIADFKTRLDAFPKDNDNVKLVTANLNDFEALLNGGLAKLEQYRKDAPEIQAKMTALVAKYDRKSLPAAIQAPFRAGQVQAWATQMRRLRETELPQDIRYLQSVADNVALPQNAVTNLVSNLTGSATWQLNDSEKLVRERIAGLVSEGMRVSDWILETDPKDPHHVLNRILGKDAFDESMERLRQFEHAVEMAKVYDEAMGSACIMGPTQTDPAAPKPAVPDRAAQAQKVQSAIAHLKSCAVTALNSVRMPKAASTDAELLKIAEETLKLEKYDVQPWLRLVINSDKVHRERREAWYAPGTVTDTITFYTYSWDQFQVTTAEKHGDEIWLYSNLLKRYESGDSTTPIGHWILSKRFELTRILPENVDKPPLKKGELK